MVLILTIEAQTEKKSMIKGQHKEKTLGLGNNKEKTPGLGKKRNHYQTKDSQEMNDMDKKQNQKCLDIATMIMTAT